VYGRGIVIAGLAAAVLVGTTGLAGAAARADGVIVACQKQGKGFLRVVKQASDCRRGERVVTWNERGQAGAPGRAGAQGARGRQDRRVPQGRPALLGLRERKATRAHKARPVRPEQRARRVLPGRRVPQVPHHSPRSMARHARAPTARPERSTSP